MAHRIAAFSDDLHSEFAPAAKLAAEAGLDGLAVRHVGGHNVQALDEADVRAVRRTADEHGLAISAVGSPYGRDFHLGDDAAQRRAETLLAQMVRFADLLGTPLIRIFALWIEGKDPLPLWADRPGTDLARVVEALAPSVALAERAGVRLMLELEGASHAGTAAEAAELIRLVDSPALVLCWDICNGWWSGEAPLPHGLDAVRVLPVVDVQTKDVKADPADPRRPLFDQVILGDGDLPYDRLLPELVASGYDGWFTVERVYHPRKPEEHPRLQRDALADVERLRSLVSLP
ncbi:sugar phosphate isomerase/epimerase family protein [Jiangella asiatica]|uniref:sugar phosphate isomerase/epimerase family protein n=1 Tax=Jiangella asiatica TaxID=2530372 RepID=UPI00193CEF30|nr:sugar phosphate isomerase/epimerase family protein [Jiangella asiatica]